MTDNPEYWILPEVLASAAARRDADNYLVDGSTSYTFASFRAAVLARAASLHDRVAVGDRVAIWLPNRAEWLICAFAIWELGGVLVPLNTRLREHDLAAALTDAEVKSVIADAATVPFDYLAVLGRIQDSGAAPSLRTVLTVGDPGGYARPGAVESLPATPGGDHRAREAAAVEDIACILFTSGTTKGSKGVLLTHRSLNNATNLATIYRPGDVIMVGFPLYAITGLLNTALAALIAGATLVLQEHFDDAATAALITGWRASCFVGIVQLFERLQRAGLSAADGGTLRGGYVFPRREVHRECFQALGLDRVAGGYGMTETAGPVTNNMSVPIRGSMADEGLAFPGNKLEIRDEAGRVLAAGESGEIWVRTPYLMAGYLNDTALSAATLVDGWLRTGDIGTRSADGRVCWRGRRSDAFKASGYNVLAAEIEQFIVTMPGVAEAAVVAIPHRSKGAVVGAFMTAEAGAEPFTAEDVIAYCRGKIATYKVPAYARILTDFPRTGTGKIRKAAIERPAELADDAETRHVD